MSKVGILISRAIYWYRNEELKEKKNVFFCR